MILKYRILSVDEPSRSYVIRYFTDIITEDDLATDFDIDNEIIRDANGYPRRCSTDVSYSLIFDSDFTPENVNFKIVTSAPYDWLVLLEKIKSNTVPGMDNVRLLMDGVHEFYPNTISELIAEKYKDQINN